MLAASWFVCGRVLRRFPVAPTAAPRLSMGAVAFALLMAAELTLSFTAFGRSLHDYLHHFTSAHGAIALAGQLAFALFPLLHAKR